MSKKQTKNTQAHVSNTPASVEGRRKSKRLAADRNHAMLYGNIALPYARAIFDMAIENEQYDRWSEQIGLFAHIAAEPPIQRLLDNPLISRFELVDLFLSIGGDTITPECKNFLYLLARNNRLQHIVRIALEYERMKRGKIDNMPFDINTAFLLTDQQRTLIEEGLYRRFGKKPEITEVLDPSLGAGVVIKSGDTVIDGSLEKKINETKQKLKSPTPTKKK